MPCERRAVHQLDAFRRQAEAGALAGGEDDENRGSRGDSTMQIRGGGVEDFVAIRFRGGGKPGDSARTSS